MNADPADVADTAARAVKARHRAMWAAGDYPAVAATLIPTLGATLVEATGVAAGQRVLDVAAGSGNAAIPAAATGAHVVACDLTPELFPAGRKAAADRGVQLEWVEADAEALPFPDAAFDVVLSCVGAMFAPHHQAVADELVRVTVPGGTIGMINWTPAGAAGQIFAAMKPYAPPPPPGAAPPPLWGEERHVRELFGTRVTNLVAQRRSVAMTLDGDPAALREFYKRNFGPTIAVYAALADAPQRVAALDRDLLDVLTRCNTAQEPDRTVVPAEYLLVTARRG